MTGAADDGIRSFYDAVAEAYAEALPDLRAEAPLDRGMIAQFVGSLPRGAAPVLDAGCGTGRMLRHLAAHEVTPLWGCDLSAEMVRLARASPPEAELTVAELADLPYADASVRGILCWYAIIHTRPEALIGIASEFARVLAPGGAILLGFQAGTGSRRIERAYGVDAHAEAFRHEPAAVVAAFEAADFTGLAVAERAPGPSKSSRQGFVLLRRC